MIKKGIIFAGLTFVSLFAYSQIFTPVKWDIGLVDSESAEKEITFTATVDPGWHVYDMNLPKGGPISTGIAYERRQGVELIGEPKSSVAPTAVYDDMFDMELRWYSGKVVFTQKIKVTDPKSFALRGEVEFMACNDETCLPPDRVSFSFGKNDVKKTRLDAPAEEAVGDAPPPDPEEVDSAETVRDSVETDIVATKPHTPAAGTTATIVQDVLTTQPELWTPVIEELRAFDRENIASTGATTSWWLVFLAGFAGGFIALLTPCVWPMIPMTVSFFLKRNKQRRKAIREAFVYGLSIIVIYLAMGLMITVVFGASALNSLSTNAFFNIVFFLLLVLFAVSFFGAFELVLPSSWTNRMDAKADTTSGILSIFFMAFTLALVSFSCTGPIIGTLLVEAASGGSVAGPAVGMAGFALALAIPFAFFAVFPNLLQNMPKSGSWLNSVKVVLGFLELALALKFLSVADLAYGWRILDREVFLVLWIVIFALLGCYLLGKIRFRHDSELQHVSVMRLFMAIISFAFSIYMLPGLWGAPLKAISAFAPPLNTQDFNLYENAVHSVFNDYEEGMAYAKKIKRPVLIDFSGFGCVNCRKMEASVWTDPQVKRLLEEQYILITLMVDDKSKLPVPIVVVEGGKKRTLKSVGEKWSYLQRVKFGANAQPFYVILNNEGKLLAPPYAYDEDVEKYVRFLSDGLKNYQQQYNKNEQ
ncbi:MAG: thioredoxin family protein [Tannerella sp.]|jgi:thiol:disulfide interchange protein DsbD|nr:thioredoxin family protein [Tannerella sp.]